jgi:hypothetical protein
MNGLSLWSAIRAMHSAKSAGWRTLCAAGRCLVQFAGDDMFFLFSSKLGCLGSALISIAVSLLLLYVLGWL